MMKIQKIILLCLVVLMSSCDDSFLDLPSKTSLSTPVYFKSQSDFEQAINGAYAPLRGFYNGSHAAWVMGEMRADNSTYKYNPNDRGTIDAEFICDYLSDASNPVIHNKYVNNYTIISRVNYLLDPIDNIEFDTNVKNNIKGQAYFLRALAYFDLVQYFGSVPMHLKPAKTLDDTAQPLASTEAIYNQIIADAKEAASLLPNKAAQEPGRATSGAAKTLLGNVYIAQKKWAEAESALKEVTGYRLMDKYEDVFDPLYKNHAESIFEVQYKEGNDGYASHFFYTFLVQPISAEEASAITGIPEIARTVEGYNIPTPDMIDAYEAGDLRKDASIGMLIAHGMPYPYIKKYCHTHAQTGNTNDNWPVYRYAEVLLFMAEALNEQNKTAEALEYLNKVRQRAGLADYTSGSQGEVREAILKERRVELAFENKRWLDLVRANKAEETMKAYGQRVKANPQAYYFPEGFTVGPNSYTNIETLFPLPASEAALSPYF
ncbi:tetratricopeptide (TPR) repeat protein [Parabacteroides sp. PFB2-12]|uniref:RagB/SusD family nutrient uptake outer membrane protein n=1 Tax=unclassified Parabacteroides TaxID=2649774 RepID=UPI0024736D6A|nr:MULTISPECIES: RagB/SusD family nutrient uptake outer membrane protein [unclassified Parabacteroides]MDH6342586.1 tetratricopeptide (TPR) repeat protein [Parabacteroides sp. PM6-13]MDH6390238.1 tetratricopeptide (TPR) repeat protein [Parabacteroides sp. PFB2-12]